jgi:ATP-dependent 26S proteasome regulatory subunit
VERLDASIADRPSRFDRKYHFPLPDEAERRRYLTHWNERTPELKLEADRLEHLVRATESFSYAYLRELFVSATIQWATRRGPEKTLSMSRLLEDNAELLQLQRVTEQSGPPPRR